MDDWNSYKSKIEIENMQQYALKIRKISYFCFVLGALTVMGKLTVRISQEMDLIPGPLEKRLSMLSSYFPFDYTYSPLFEIIWLMQWLSTMLATCVYSGLYSLFFGLVLHLQCQISNLRYNIENIEYFTSINGNMDERKFKEKISFIIERHVNLNRFAKGIENIFNLIFLIEIMGCTIQLCLQIFMMVIFLSKDNNQLMILDLIFMAVFISHIIVHLFMSCYAADKLREESLSICDAAYNTRWYNFPVRYVKPLINIMHRAKNPLEIRAGRFCSISMSLFTQILKNSIGYLSMLLAVKDKIID